MWAKLMDAFDATSCLKGLALKGYTIEELTKVIGRTPVARFVFKWASKPLNLLL